MNYNVMTLQTPPLDNLGQKINKLCHVGQPHRLGSAVSAGVYAALLSRDAQVTEPHA
jgi:hypothetical protein